MRLRGTDTPRMDECDLGAGPAAAPGTSSDAIAVVADPAWLAGTAELRLAERSRREAHELFEVSFAAAPIGIALIAPDGRWLKVNRAVCEITGYAEDELLRLTFQDLTHPDDLAHNFDLTRQLLAGEISSYQTQKRYITQKGREIWARLSVSLVRDGSGEPRHFVSHIEDISQAKLDEWELTRQRDYLDALVSSMGDGFLLTKDGTIADVNPAMCELVSYAREELIGMRVPYPFWAPEAIAEINDYRARVASASGPCGLETCYVRRDGTRVDVAITTVATAPFADEPLGYLSTVRDITQQNRDRAELEQLATRDALTGLLNRHGFRERLRDEIARARRHESSLSLAILDIDFFKDINDRYGHPAGDQVLREIAHRLAGLVRESEHFARIGGEEFAWILPDATATGAFAAAERARHSTNTIPFSGVGTVTLSAGVCELSAVDSPDTLYQRADDALYAAKQQGRNRTILCDPYGAAAPYPAIG